MAETIERLRERLTAAESALGGPRRHPVSLRVSAEEKRVLEALASVLEVSVADLLRPRIEELMAEADRIRRIADRMAELEAPTVGGEG